MPLVVLAVVWLAGRIGGGRVPTRLGWGVAGVILVVQAWTDMQRLPESGWDPGVARQVLGGLKHGKHVELAESVRTQARAVWPHHREFESE